MASKRNRYKRRGGKRRRTKKGSSRSWAHIGCAKPYDDVRDYDRDFAMDEEQFHLEQKKAQEELEQLHLEEYELDQSEALQRARANQANECTAVLVNIPFRVSAAELVDWLLSEHLNNKYHLNNNNDDDDDKLTTGTGSSNSSSRAVYSCDIMRHKSGRRRGTSSGKAIIRMLKTAFDYLVYVGQTSGLRLQDRHLKIFEGYKAPSHNGQNEYHTSSSFALKSLYVGHPSKTDLRSNPSCSSIYYHWKNTTSKSEIIFNEREARQLCIKVGKNLRFDFDLRHLAQLRVGVDKDGRRAVLLHFRLPPYCFRSRSTREIGYDPEIRLLFDRVRGLDIFREKKDEDDSAYHWDIDQKVQVGESKSRSNDGSREEMIRTTDPAGSTFGQCRTYQLVFMKPVHSKEDSSLLKCFREFGIKSTIDQSVFTTSCDQYPPSFEEPKYAWCGGFKYLSGLDFSTRYLIHCMLSNSYLIIPTGKHSIQLANALRGAGTDLSNEVLEYFLEKRFATSCNNLVEKIQEHHNMNITTGENFAVSESRGNLANEFLEHDYGSDSEDGDLQEILVQRVLITPTRVCPQLPSMEQSNRILRKFHSCSDRFLRVSFAEENFGSIFNALSDSDDILEKRLREVMHNGVYVGGEHFIFLHYSSSQLREQSCWFYNESASKGLSEGKFVPKASDIRRFMGREDCRHLRVIGKHAARMGQGFSTSVPTISIKPSMKRVIADVEHNGFCFSDGVGTISHHLAEQVASKLELRDKVLPSAYQIRIGGAKGVVSVYDGTFFKGESTVSQLSLRPSMIKFETDNSNDLEVISYSKPMHAYLNRQIITILSSLGIADEVFLDRLDDIIQILSNCLTSTTAAKEFARHSTDEHLVYCALSSGFDITRDRHLRGLLLAQRNRFLLDLELRSRIFIPNGVSLLGILDETNVLEYGQVFFQYTDPTTKELIRLPPGTRVAVCRSPCLHPGDVRVLTMAEASQALGHWVNVIVFPQKGARPHPDEMSGGDLDGDIYTVFYDEDLLPSKSYAAMSVSSTREKPKITNTELVKTIEIANFFVDYIQNDNLGRIANAHLALSDALGARHHLCIKLAELHSTAVDFAKTGVAAKFPQELVPKRYPDFMQNKTKGSYDSKKVLGKIFRTVKELIITNPEDMVNDHVDECMVLPGSEQYLEDAQVTQLEYNQELFVIMRRFDLVNEQEMWSGFVKEFSSKMGYARKGNGQLQERLNREMSNLKKEFRAIFWSDMEEEDEYEAMKKVSAWYQVAYDRRYRQEEEGIGYQTSFISFPWIMSDLLCKIKALSS